MNHLRAPLFLLLFTIGWSLCSTGRCAGQANVGNGSEEGATPVVVSRPAPATRVESMLLKKGIVLVRGYSEVATLQAEDGAVVRVTAIELIDSTHRSREYGLAIEVARGDRHVVSYLDYDEIDEIIAAFANLARLDNAVTHLNSYEASYRTRGGLDVTSYSDNGSRVISIRATQYLDPSNQLIVATTSFRLASLPDLSRNITAGKQLLDKTKSASD